MKSPQIENGYIKIANEIWQALGSTRISGEEWQVLNCIFAKTYGFNKKTDRISLSQFCAWTGINKPNVVRALHKLIIKKIVIKNDNGKITLYCFNKLYGEWESLSKKITVIKKDNASLSKKIHTKDNTTKDNNTPTNIRSYINKQENLQKPASFNGIGQEELLRFRNNFPKLDIDYELEQFILDIKARGLVFHDYVAEFGRRLNFEERKRKSNESEGGGILVLRA